jgi:hypothetical protein
MYRQRFSVKSSTVLGNGACRLGRVAAGMFKIQIAGANSEVAML